MSDVFFDTSVVVAHMRGRYDSLERAGRQNTVFISATVLGELWHGIRKSASPEQGKTLPTRRSDRKSQETTTTHHKHEGKWEITTQSEAPNASPSLGAMCESPTFQQRYIREILN